jgi:hypothetical protein
LEVDRICFFVDFVLSELTRQVVRACQEPGRSDASSELKLDHLEPTSFLLPADALNHKITQRHVWVVNRQLNEVIFRGPVESVAAIKLDFGFIWVWLVWEIKLREELVFEFRKCRLLGSYHRFNAFSEISIALLLAVVRGEWMFLEQRARERRFQFDVKI